MNREQDTTVGKNCSRQWDKEMEKGKTEQWRKNGSELDREI